MGDRPIPLAQIERIMRNAGAERLSSTAIEELRGSTEELGEELAQEAVSIAKRDGRSTIELTDIKEAVSS